MARDFFLRSNRFTIQVTTLTQPSCRATPSTIVGPTLASSAVLEPAVLQRKKVILGNKGIAKTVEEKTFTLWRLLLHEIPIHISIHFCIGCSFEGVEAILEMRGDF